MANPSDEVSPDQRAQLEYDRLVVLLRGLHGKDRFSFEIASHDHLGGNSLKLLLNKFGAYDAGWIDDVKFDDFLRDRLLAFTRQETVSTNAIAKSALRGVYEANRRLKVIQWMLVFLVVLILGAGLTMMLR